RSRASRIAASASPTTCIDGRPGATSTSTRTGGASSPHSAQARVVARPRAVPSAASAATAQDRIGGASLDALVLTTGTGLPIQRHDSDALGLTPAQVDGDQLQPVGGIAPPDPGQVRLRETLQASSLGRGDRFDGHPERGWLTRLHLAEHERVPVAADDVELARARAHVPRYDHIAACADRANGDGLGVGADAAPIHLRSHRTPLETQTRPPFNGLVAEALPGRATSLGATVYFLV